MLTSLDALALGKRNAIPGMRHNLLLKPLPCMLVCYGEVIYYYNETWYIMSRFVQSKDAVEQPPHTRMSSYSSLLDARSPAFDQRWMERGERETERRNRRRRVQYSTRAKESLSSPTPPPLSSSFLTSSLILPPLPSSLPLSLSLSLSLSLFPLSSSATQWFR